MPGLLGIKLTQIPLNGVKAAIHFRPQAADLCVKITTQA